MLDRNFRPTISRPQLLKLLKSLRGVKDADLLAFRSHLLDIYDHPGNDVQVRLTAEGRACWMSYKDAVRESLATHFKMNTGDIFLRNMLADLEDEDNKGLRIGLSGSDVLVSGYPGLFEETEQ